MKLKLTKEEREELKKYPIIFQPFVYLYSVFVFVECK